MGDEERDPYEYAPFEKWEYRPVLFKSDNSRTWIGVREGYYEASLGLIQALAKGKLSEDLEGIAAYSFSVTTLSCLSSASSSRGVGSKVRTGTRVGARLKC